MAEYVCPFCYKMLEKAWLESLEYGKGGQATPVCPHCGEPLLVAQDDGGHFAIERFF